MAPSKDDVRKPDTVHGGGCRSVKDGVPSDAVYSMGVVERMTGLTARQVRYWEQHGLVAPARSKGRHRLYSEADVIRLKEIKRLVASGMSMDRVKACLTRRKAASPQGQAPALPADLIAQRLTTLPAGPVRSLHTGGKRAALQRLIDRKPSP